MSLGLDEVMADLINDFVENMVYSVNNELQCLCQEGFDLIFSFKTQEETVWKILKPPTSFEVPSHRAQGFMKHALTWLTENLTHPHFKCLMLQICISVGLSRITALGHNLKDNVSSSNPITNSY